MFISLLSSIDVKTWMWMIPLLLFLHEMEEWNILDWYHSTYVSPPKSTKLSIRLWLFIMSIGGFAITTIASVISNTYISAGITIALVVFTTFNGLQHVYWQFAFEKYAPGVIFSSLGIVAGALITAAALTQELVSPIYVIVLYAFTIPFLVSTFRAKNKLIGTFENLHNLTLRIVKVLEN